MSGGMQQRLQIARCLAQEPAALMMDEPFGALDAMTRQACRTRCWRSPAATGATIFFVTHDLEEAIYLGDRVIGLLPHPGRIGIELKVDLPRPRDQVATRESPEFLAPAPPALRFHPSRRRRERDVEGRRALALPAAAARPRRDRRARSPGRATPSRRHARSPWRFVAGARRRLAARRDARHADQRLRRPRDRRAHRPRPRHPARPVAPLDRVLELPSSCCGRSPRWR